MTSFMDFMCSQNNKGAGHGDQFKHCSRSVNISWNINHCEISREHLLHHLLSEKGEILRNTWISCKYRKLHTAQHISVIQVWGYWMPAAHNTVSYILRSTAASCHGNCFQGWSVISWGKNWVLKIPLDVYVIWEC